LMGSKMFPYPAADCFSDSHEIAFCRYSCILISVTVTSTARHTHTHEAVSGRKKTSVSQHLTSSIFSFMIPSAGGRKTILSHLMSLSDLWALVDEMPS
jgi:hypothetical protein